MKNKSQKWIKLEKTTSQYGVTMSNLTCTHINPQRDYVRVLDEARTYRTAQELYGVHNPTVTSLRKLEYLGYIRRYTQPKYLVENYAGCDIVAARKIWWKTTFKGNKLLHSIGL